MAGVDKDLPYPLEVIPAVPALPNGRTGRVIFYDGFERNKHMPWHWFDGGFNQIFLDSQISFQGDKSLHLRSGIVATLQDASVVIPVPSGVVGIGFWFTFQPFLPTDGELLLSIEKRKSAGDNQLQEMWFEYLLGTGAMQIRQQSTLTLVKTISPRLAGIATAVGATVLPTFETVATDRASISWHYFKAVCDIKNGKYIKWILDDQEVDLTSYGTSQWYEPAAHTFGSNLGVYRFELHSLRPDALTQTGIWFDEVVITDES